MEEEPETAPFFLGLSDCRAALERLVALLLGANPDRLLDGTDEQFAVANLSGVRGFGDGIQAGLGVLVRDDQFQLDLR